MHKRTSSAVNSTLEWFFELTSQSMSNMQTAVNFDRIFYRHARRKWACIAGVINKKNVLLFKWFCYYLGHGWQNECRGRTKSLWFSAKPTQFCSPKCYFLDDLEEWKETAWKNRWIVFILNKWCIGTYEFTLSHTSASVVCDAAVIHYFAVESVYLCLKIHSVVSPHKLHYLNIESQVHVVL